MKKLTKEEKEQIKKRNKEISKATKPTKILVIVIISILILRLINMVIMYFSNDYAYFYIKNIANTINGILFNISSNIDYLSFIFVILFAVVMIVVIIIQSIIPNSKKDIKLLNKKYNRLTCIYLVFLFIMAFILFNNFELCFLPNSDILYFNDTKDKTYQKDDLINLGNYLKDEVIKYSSSIGRDKNNIVITDNNYNELVVNEMKRASNEIPLLKGLYPKRSTDVSNTLKSFVGSSTSGLTHLYSTYFDYSQDPTSILQTITHEFCHSKGITRENEAVYCSFYVGITSNNNVMKYSALIEAFLRTRSAIADIDGNLANDLEDEVLSKCMINNYNEFCDVYPKNTDEYIKGAKTLIIYSYYLKNYKNDKEELYNSLKVLKDNGAKILSNDNEVTLDEVMNLIDEDANNYINIIIENFNSKIFNKIKESISNSKLYLEIYQENKEYDVDDERKENPISYYLNPFDTKDYYLFNYKSYGSVKYDYDRVVRLLLEYYDKYGY